MALAGRTRSIIPRFYQLLKSESQAQKTALLRPLICHTIANPEQQVSRNFATESKKTEQKVKVPLVLFGGAGKCATSLYVAAVTANALDQVETNLLYLVEASKRSPDISEFIKDPTVPKDARVDVIVHICDKAKFSHITKDFLGLLALNGKLRYLDSITKKFQELAMAHRGEVKVIVTTVIPLPAEEEKELKDIMQDIIGEGKKVILEQKIDPSILGGLVVEYDWKLIDISIKTRAQEMERMLREPINFDSIL